MFARFRSSFFQVKRFVHQQADLVRVSSIDHDGCFGLQNMAPSQVKEMHGHVIDFLNHQKKIAGYRYDYVMSYSHRQSIRIDYLNALHNQNNLAFPVANALAHAIGAHFDPFLLSDISANKKPGFTISHLKRTALLRGIKILEDQLSDDELRLLSEESGAESVISTDKINILYAQLHRIKLIHPTSIIHFYVYDNLINEVLMPAIKFYKKYEALRPSLIDIHFYYFNSLDEKMNLPILIDKLSGTGSVDKNYYKTVTTMADVAKNEEGEKSEYKMSSYMTPSKMGYP